MASSLIHMAVCKKVNEVLNLDEREILLGSIAPDIAKIVGIPKKVTHFCTDTNNIPIIDDFMKKYQTEIKTPFAFGYLIHLLTDELWFSEYLKNFLKDQHHIYDKEGNLLKFSNQEINDLLYNDYTNMNQQILDYYRMDLSLFYEPFDYPISPFTEFKDSYYGPLIDKIGLILTRTENYNYILKIESIIHFINYCAVYVIDELKKYHLI